MSKKQTQNTDQAPEKVVTKYDLKMQRRKEEKERAEKSRRRDNIIGIVIVAALVCLVASFPIRNYLTVHGNYVKINGENISRVEFDYEYNMAVSSYLSQYGYYLYMMGIDPASDFSSQMYSETLTWGDYFQQLAVENMIRNKSLSAQAKAEGFTYDTTGDYARYSESLEAAASENGTTVKDYVKELYGPYATLARLKPYVEESLYVAGYYDELSGRQTPSAEEIQAYYEENKATYDSVDYYVTTVDAELPTEPTELADSVEETEDEAAEDGAEGEEQAYQPSEAEIEAAMAEAKEQADRVVKTVKTDGELRENVRRSTATYLLQDWLFDEERKAGDSTVIEDSSSHRYYAVEFAGRYLDETLAADIRVIVTDAENGQAILDEWKAGAATEESFAELCDKHNDPAAMSAEGGLLEAVTSASLPTEVSDWIHEEGRAEGDSAVISPEGEENTYVLYYKGTNEAEWILSIRQTMISQRMSEYVDGLMAEGTVDDPKGNLNYLKAQAEEEAAAQESSEAASEEGAGSEDEGSSESAVGSEDSESSEASGGEEDAGAEDSAE
ncbi:MAG: hypothetical protein HFH95_04990 [Lachnospiraceae bacterium]|nr:SurA N-terminal domain-containing protein [uncultured Acetatifactor sp.]MCI8542656.1 hypothetical protein [Lachnospiraceae bacterium]